MGTQVGNATPTDDVATAATDTGQEPGETEATSFGATTWTEEGGHEY